MNGSADVVVIGAGPAGCAAALAARRRGLRVVVIDALDRPRLAPGETLHPGIEPMLAELGVWERVSKAGFHRHRGIWNEWAGRRWFTAYGDDDAGPWLGLQADRRTLHTLLQDAAMEAGAELRRGVTPVDVLDDGGRIGGVRTKTAAIRARWVFDATGVIAWLAHRLALPVEHHSPPLRIRFGWTTVVARALDGQPLFRRHAEGWDWQAPLGNGRLAWVTLRVTPHRRRRASYAWRLHRRAAGPGYFVLGDAAALLDPAASNGVLRAMMSGVLAAHLVRAMIDGRDEDTAGRAYVEWIERTYFDCVAELRRRGAAHEDLPHAAAYLGVQKW